MHHCFTGFGFGPIQASLFAAEAIDSGNFESITLAEIDGDIVEAVNANRGSYLVNIADSDGITSRRYHGVTMLNPNRPADLAALRDALTGSTEVATCLPSTAFYDKGGDAAVADLLAGPRSGPLLVYTAENDTHAAEKLQVQVASKNPRVEAVQFANTVIGKMCQVICGADEIAARGLAPLAPGLDRAVLVEAFNRIHVTACTLPGFRPGIEPFVEHDDLRPYEHAKLYGHNAIHALMGYLAHRKGLASMPDACRDPAIKRIAHTAFIEESGAALVRKYQGLGDLFTEEGFRAYALDLLDRMANPYLDDAIARVIRDPDRKLGWNDRLVGAMRLARDEGIEARNIALGAAAALLQSGAGDRTAHLRERWADSDVDPGECDAITGMILEACDRLDHEV